MRDGGTAGTSWKVKCGDVEGIGVFRTGAKRLEREGGSGKVKGERAGKLSGEWAKWSRTVSRAIPARKSAQRLNSRGV